MQKLDYQIWYYASGPGKMTPILSGIFMWEYFSSTVAWRLLKALEKSMAMPFNVDKCKVMQVILT